MRNSKKNIKKLYLRDNITFSRSQPKTYKDIFFLLPSQWTFIVLKSSKSNFYSFYLFSHAYFFKFAIPRELTSISICKNTNVVSGSSYYFTPNIYVWVKEVNTIISTLTSFLFKKLKFKGKGYYIYKNARNTIAPQFGYYHRIYIYSFFNKVKFLSKTKLLIFGLIKKDIVCTSYALKSKRTINIFTGRGVRFARQLIYKKTGKVSSYR